MPTLQCEIPDIYNMRSNFPVLRYADLAIDVHPRYLERSLEATRAHLALERQDVPTVTHSNVLGVATIAATARSKKLDAVANGVQNRLSRHKLTLDTDVLESESDASTVKQRFDIFSSEKYLPSQDLLAIMDISERSPLDASLASTALTALRAQHPDAVVISDQPRHQIKAYKINDENPDLAVVSVKTDNLALMHNGEALSVKSRGYGLLDLNTISDEMARRAFKVMMFAASDPNVTFDEVAPFKARAISWLEQDPAKTTSVLDFLYVSRSDIFETI